MFAVDSRVLDKHLSDKAVSWLSWFLYLVIVIDVVAID